VLQGRDYSRPGKPTDNAFIESLNGKFRAECLNANWFMTLDEAARKCLRSIGEFLDRIRPQRPILAASSDAVAAGRFGKYLEILVADADATLDDVEAPDVIIARAPQFDEIAAARLSAATRIVGA
jgi:transposase InsO family protein